VGFFAVVPGITSHFVIRGWAGGGLQLGNAAGCGAPCLATLQSGPACLTAQPCTDHYPVPTHCMQYEPDCTKAFISLLSYLWETLLFVSEESPAPDSLATSCGW